LKATEGITISAFGVCGCTPVKTAERANSPVQAEAGEGKNSVFEELFKDCAAGPGAAEKGAPSATEGREDADEKKPGGEVEAGPMGAAAFFAGLFFTQAADEVALAEKSPAASIEVEAVEAAGGGVTLEAAGESILDGIGQPAPVFSAPVEADIGVGDLSNENQAAAAEGLRQAGESPPMVANNGGYITPVNPEWGIPASGETGAGGAVPNGAGLTTGADAAPAGAAPDEGAVAGENSVFSELKESGYELVKAAAPSNREAAAQETAAKTGTTLASGPADFNAEKNAGFEASAPGAPASKEDEHGVRTATNADIRVKADIAVLEAESGLAAPERSNGDERASRKAAVPMPDEGTSPSENGSSDIADRIVKALKEVGGQHSTGEKASPARRKRRITPRPIIPEQAPQRFMPREPACPEQARLRPRKKKTTLRKKPWTGLRTTSYLRS
jgi:hypothetical protein